MWRGESFLIKFFLGTVISRNFARAIIVFKHHFSPALKWTQCQNESFQKLKHTWRLFISFRVQLGIKTDPALFRTRAILREITVHTHTLRLLYQLNTEKRKWKYNICWCIVPNFVIIFVQDWFLWFVTFRYILYLLSVF